MSDFVERDRWRRIVKKAAEATSLPALKNWFERDEKGVWEKEAKELWECPKQQAHKVSRGWSDAQFEDAVAGTLAMLGLMSMIK